MSQEPAPAPPRRALCDRCGRIWSCHGGTVLRTLRLLQRCFGWDWAVLVVRRDDDVGTLKLPDDLPVSVRPNTDGSVGLTVGHDDHGEALLADLRALMG